ncbi:ATP-binding protein [Jonesia quinghaiensis]|uniref:ATP-binding protein n=1 Tax=Jonesia quinghaiensis TaxID=262806 RepID=UPI0004294177|nr:ATP-binding protein [Jonesia quinghaiensis]
MTFVDSLFGLIPRESTGQQWLAESLQLVNWGGYHGHHALPFHPEGTLLSGGSGTGKSTLLDAYIALMMPHTTPFNGASNSATSGRARGQDQRNIISYVRGKTDDRPTATGPTETVLRGGDSDTWSAVAMTWRDQRGALMTALRIFYVPRRARRNDECVFHRATVEGKFDLRRLVSHAQGRFSKRTLTQVEGLTLYDTDAAFFTRLHSALGIGAAGGGAKAMQLLARIQAGQHISTVDALYKQMVLEEPATFDTAAKAVAHFDELSTVRQEMMTAQQQVAHLEPIRELKGSLEQAREGLHAIDDAGLLTDTSDTSPFTVWRDRRIVTLLGSEIANNRQEFRRHREERAQALAQESALDTQLDTVRTSIRNEGGDSVDALTRDLRGLEESARTVEATRSTLDRHLHTLDATVTTRRDFDSVQRTAREFLNGLSEREQELRDQHYQALRRRDAAQTRRDDIAAQLSSLRARQGNIPAELHEARCQLAAACGMEPHDLPFVGELVEVRAEYETWRTALSAALGGFAVTLLVDEEKLPDFRRAINSLTLRRRISFEGVPTHMPQSECEDRRLLPGRLEYRRGRFTGWLQERLLQSFALVCVNDPAELNSHPQALTVTGQTSQGRRGSHGGLTRAVLGFSNDGAIVALSAEAAACDEKIAQETGAADAAAEAQATLRNVVRAHEHILTVSWDNIDVAAAQQLAENRRQQLEDITAGSDIVAQLKREENEISAQLSAVRTRIAHASARIEDLEATYAGLVDIEDAAKDRLENVEDTTLDPRIEKLLDSRVEQSHAGSIAEFDAAVTAMIRELQVERHHAQEKVQSVLHELERVFTQFLARWPNPNVGSHPERSFEDFERILTELEHQRLYELREKWDRTLTLLSGHELTTLNAQISQAIDEIRQRMEPVNDILWKLPFQDDHHRLKIVAKVTESQDIRSFRHELKELATQLGADSAPADRERHYARMAALLNRVRPESPEHRRLIDVREHVKVDAMKVDLQGTEVSVFDHIAGKSGGESQELVAFIVGAALRYQLGDADAARPRYAPVFLDEAFIKADSRFAGRSVSAWKGLGFQLIVGAPLDKVSALEPHMSLLVQTVKDSKGLTQLTWSLATDAALPGINYTQENLQNEEELQDNHVIQESLLPSNHNGRGTLIN